MKKPFRETKGGKILKGIFNGALDVLPIPDVRNWFAKDKDGDGKINYKEVDYFKVAGGVAVLSLLLWSGIVDLDQIIALIKALTGN